MSLFLAFALQEFTASSMYRLELAMRFLGNLIQMYGVYWLWNTLYAQNPALISTSLEQMVSYAVLAMVLEVVLNDTGLPRWYIARQVRTGDIQMDLVRPLGFTYHMLARSAGGTVFLLLALGLPSVLFAALFLGLMPPASLVHGLLFLPSLGISFLVGFALNYLIGLVSIYSIATRRISWVYNAMLAFFSGQMVPLWIFPPLLAQIAAFLPFQAMIGIPLSIYIGRLPLLDAVRALGVQALWAAGLLALGEFVWHQAQRRLIVQGG